jgi:broad specificity phosphatase PhoE
MLYFIRHAESQYNAVEKEMEKKLGPDYQSSQEYLD